MVVALALTPQRPLAADFSCDAAAWTAQPMTLERVLARQDCHPTVRAARAALMRARADETTAGQRPNPVLSLGAYSIARGGVGPGRLMDKTFDHQVRVDQTVERGGKRELRQDAARREVQAASAELEQIRIDARADLAMAYWDLRASLARVQALAEFMDLSAQSLKLLERRVQAGDAPAMDLARLQVDDARLRSESSQAQAEARAAASRLGVALGLEGPLPPMSSDLAQPPRPVSAGPGTTEPAQADAALVARAVQARADVRAAAARSAAAEQRVRLATALRKPDLNVGVQADRYPASLANPSGSGNTVSFSVSVPLLVAHAHEGEIAGAVADWQAAQDQEFRVREAAWALAEQALSQARAARVRREAAESVLEPAAMRLAAAAEAAYARGGISMLELLEARRALRLARLERLTLQTEDAKAALRWQTFNPDGS